MDGGRTGSILEGALRAAGGRAPRGVIAGALAVSGAAAAFLGGRGVFVAPADHAGLLVGTGAALWLLWAFAGGAVTVHAGFAAAGRAQGFRASLSRAWRRLFALAFAPVFALLAAATILGFAVLLAQVVRVPAVGVILLALLSPAILFLAVAGLRIVLSHVLVGSLAAADLALGERGGFGALAGAYGLLRRGGAGTLLRRALCAGRAVLAGAPGAVLTAGGAAAVGLALWWTAKGALFPVACALRHGHGGVWTAEGLAATAAGAAILGAAAWALAWPVAMLFGARAALFLSERRRLDGLEPESAVPAAAPGKTLAELGVELVERLRRDGEEAR